MVCDDVIDNGALAVAEGRVAKDVAQTLRGRVLMAHVQSEACGGQAQEREASPAELYTAARGSWRAVNPLWFFSYWTSRKKTTTVTPQIHSSTWYSGVLGGR